MGIRSIRLIRVYPLSVWTAACTRRRRTASIKRPTREGSTVFDHSPQGSRELALLFVADEAGQRLLEQLGRPEA